MSCRIFATFAGVVAATRIITNITANRQKNTVAIQSVIQFITTKNVPGKKNAMSNESKVKTVSRFSQADFLAVEIRNRILSASAPAPTTLPAEVRNANQSNVPDVATVKADFQRKSRNLSCSFTSAILSSTILLKVSISD